MTKTILCLLLGLSTCFCNKGNASAAVAPQVGLLSGAAAVVTPSPVAGSAYTGSLYLSYSGGNGAVYTAGNEIASSGVEGLTAVLQEGTLLNGMGSLTYNISGLPASAGNAVFNLSFGGQSATVTVVVAEKAAANLLYWGFFDDSGTPLSSYAGYGKKASTTMMFDHWDVDGNKDFPVAFCNTVSAAGYLPHVTWEPRLGLTELMSGKYDNDIKKYGESIALFGKPVILRFAHEFNGDWYPWSINGEELVPAATYVQAFRYVQDRIKAAGAANAFWAWAPNCVNGAKNPQSLESYYPGDDYVDLVGMDGYNFGTSQTWSNWQSFSAIFGNLYDWINKNHPDKPIFIAEMGCSSTGGDKIAWINDMFVQLEKTFPKIRSFVWFNINKETDWRFTETQGSINAFKAGVNGARVVADASLGGLLK
ncbi:MAG: glycosyl hydrolase [Candidatus Pseudobacter hemicellulosilyticus]|uniref:Glycosyl hydrolase n=1 Tax=Candidatus Pseudobacter hemicellulosilyticus TaxID=3121375 RepID=A0AAJ5WXF9_9BACT|nr:MAG: glycosyl hydrolase [Pseudobacter sp.]